MLEGNDISQYQGVMNWDKFKTSGRKFVLIRATVGNLVDTKFKENWKNAKASGIPRGAWHYFWPSMDGITQAKFFIDQLDGDFGEIPPSGDWEEQYGADISTNLSRFDNFLDRTEYLTNIVPMIYTGLYYWNKFGSRSTYYQRYPLWLADYNPPIYIPDPWDTLTFLQWGSGGDGPSMGTGGGPIDMDTFYGSMEELLALKYGGLSNMLHMKVKSLEGVNVRVAPVYGSTILRLLPFGTPVTVLYIQEDAGTNLWAKISTNEWVALKYGSKVYLEMA